MKIISLVATAFAFALSQAASAQHDGQDWLNVPGGTQAPELDFIEQATFASDSYPDPMTHWGIFCLNHIVDVVSCSEPASQVSVAN